MTVISSKQIDRYIATFPPETQVLLEQIRGVVRVAAPGAEEIISYRMPAYRFHGMLVFFAGYDHHIGFYPGASGIKTFKEELSGYKGAKGSVRFPLDKPLPLELICRIVKFRVDENLQKAARKKGGAAASPITGEREP
ncbi:MAG: DUF1801 domain-containing protein [Bacteroidota bacterium]